MRIVLFSRMPAGYSFRGDGVVQRLTAEGHEVVGIVCERLSPVQAAREWMGKLGPQVVVKKVLSRVLRISRRNGSAASPSSTSGAALVDPPVYWVEQHNSPACVEVVRSLRPDIGFLRGCGIIRKSVLDVPKIGTLNGHYGALPTYRGVDVTEWSVLLGDRPTVTVHWVDDGVDTGAAIAARHVPLAGASTLGEMREKCSETALELLVEVLRKIEAGEVAKQPEHGHGKQYFRMHPRLRALALEQLRRSEWVRSS
jgi:methionyl-tRNA formyltransferase